MTDPSVPESAPKARVYRPAPSATPPLSRTEDARPISQRLLAISEEFDDAGLLEDLDPTDRELVERRVREETMFGIVSLRWVNLSIAAILLLLNGVRWRMGYFADLGPTGGLYVVTFGAHLMIAVGVGIAFWIAAERRRDPSAQVRRVAAVHMSLICGGLLLVAVLGLFLRGSTFGFAVATLVGNLVYHLPRRGRVLLNATASGIAILGVLFAARGDPASAVLRFAELTTALLLTVLTGNLVRRQRVRSVIVEQRLSSMALVDGLTGVASRRRVEEVAEGELAMSASDRPLSIILLDLDDFKQINDTHGHNAGDEVLRGVARLLQQRSRLNDTVGRWGGEEFLMILPDTPATGALELAETLRGRIARQLFEGIGTCTASFGVAESRAGDSLSVLIARADGALYDAKRAGRNRVREAVPPELTGTRGSPVTGTHTTSGS